ncbi:hypothetical protein [Micromonospora sp. URMC 103]|uniref:hypothetical protein n=1 Tax=Micromonospora sp. URMC 103 TaxID=3423406 RepID=UPI003F1C3719
MNRLYGRNSRWASANAFADAFQGGCWPERTSVYRISRWETAVVRIPHLAVRRYEQLLDLPPGSLVALLDTVYRYFAPAVPSSPLLARRPTSPEADRPSRMDELLDLVLSGSTVTGSDWDELTATLAAAPRQVIAPRNAWRIMAERLLAEMIIADGLPWMQRHEAMHRLLSHPIAQQAAVAACADLAADGTGQVFVETVSILDGSPHPDASRHLLAQLVNPTNDRAQYGALLGAIRKLQYGHFTKPQTTQLVSIAHAMLIDSTPNVSTQPLAAELLRRVPDECAATMQARQVPGSHASAAGANAGRTERDEATRAVARRIARATVAWMPFDVLNFRDRLLPVVLHEMLFSPVFDVRMYAAMLLAGTPYRRPLAAILGTELSASAPGGPVRWTLTLIEALRIIGTAQQRPMMERLTIAAGLPPAITLSAIQAIGHIGGESDNRYWRAAIAHHVLRWRQTRTGTPVPALVGLVYALGIARNEHMLQLVRRDIASPGECRAAASWWLNLPTYILDSAAR